ncbi:hypothetical protein EVAR_99978_1 [Eumeta japonica]|uniref:Uncharacterized protein n=1 Tax=Eumeta variegata TaxID=151549 RepID=A0A4C1ZIY3_EUMVA|nr:hypothetical protein EVAR_99978_1 [Eumeta japonica]
MYSSPPLHQISYFYCQEAGNALVTPFGLQVSMGGGDHLLFRGSHAGASDKVMTSRALSTAIFSEVYHKGACRTPSREIRAAGRASPPRAPSDTRRTRPAAPAAPATSKPSCYSAMTSRK